MNFAGPGLNLNLVNIAVGARIRVGDRQFIEDLPQRGFRRMNSMTVSELYHNHFGEIYNTGCLEDCIAKHDVKKIVHDKDLFWLLFCTSFEKTGQRPGDTSFSVQSTGETVHVMGITFHIDTLSKWTERMRQIMKRCFDEKKSIVMCSVKRTVTSSFTRFHLMDPGLSQLSIQADDAKLDNEEFQNYMQPSLIYIASLLHAKFSEVIEKKKVLYDSIEEEMDVYTQKFTFGEDIYTAFPIPPQPIPPRPLVDEALHDMYKNGILCDFSLIGNGDKGEITIPIHATALYLRGGEAFKKMLTTGFHEQASKELRLSTYSEGVLKLFAESLYLDSEKFSELLRKHENINDIFELLGLAHMYMNEPLMNFCTNALSLRAAKEHIPLLEQMSTDYDNNHLQQLASYLKKRDEVTNQSVAPSQEKPK